jgi:hypothetical protein
VTQYVKLFSEFLEEDFPGDLDSISNPWYISPRRAGRLSRGRIGHIVLLNMDILIVKVRPKLLSIIVNGRPQHA